ncbi:MAG: hypothetical protein H8D61_02345 [Deltaproteobacteria bacterium]|nr:hypothetical protein [Deltaproteobacteria bacterium]
MDIYNRRYAPSQFFSIQEIGYLHDILDKYLEEVSNSLIALPKMTHYVIKIAVVPPSSPGAISINLFFVADVV